MTTTANKLRSTSAPTKAKPLSSSTNAIATVIDSKNKPKTEEKPKKPNLGINKKHHDESVDDTSKAESTNDITLGNTEDVSIDSKEDVKIDNDEDIKF
ncbi:MAG: hypothetical protein L6V82_08135 [Clostridiales bacterium]|nr:MAG: hypothetical protein L6V82_08135 [Clostridiales bacterium]